eukprot:SAG25_NODE_387_length_8678_cov_163.615573_3_plen_90_part_00
MQCGQIALLTSGRPPPSTSQVVVEAAPAMEVEAPSSPRTPRAAEKEEKKTVLVSHLCHFARITQAHNVCAVVEGEPALALGATCVVAGD